MGRLPVHTDDGKVWEPWIAIITTNCWSATLLSTLDSLFLVTRIVTNTVTIGVVIHTRRTSVQRPPIRVTKAWPLTLMDTTLTCRATGWSASACTWISVTPLLKLVLEAVIGLDLNRGDAGLPLLIQNLKGHCHQYLDNFEKQKDIF